ncbi:amidohydrolase family protein [Rhabdothermincola sediminis]|uniref:amidohydrolase family protein n=1 Tax=Rhabdothermincola sediminis TaxID=2751370 RepID=UPI001AA0AA9D|nr:amidohydrolase family protein [Rhabdothermincola sediminis]
MSTTDAASRPARAFDADNHYYEATDAFIRHVDPKMRGRCMRWAEIDGRQRLLVGGKINRFIPNPTFDPVSKPGALIDYFRGKTSITDLHSAFGELDPIQPAYRDPAARVEVMDAQGLTTAFLFPTLGVGMEGALSGDRPALLAAFRGFNRWLLDDWTYDYQGRLYAAPYLTLADVDWAVEELEFVLAHGARIINMRPGPISDPSGNRSFGHPSHDPFWARVNEAGVTVAFHAGDAGYGFMLEQWGVNPEFQAFRLPALFQLLTMSPIADTVASFLADGIFLRFPNIRVATIENGSEWVRPLFGRLKKSFQMRGPMWQEDPRETFRRHVWVAPFYEDDLVELRELIGVDRMIFGSDFPHAEGLADPLSYVDDLAAAGFDATEIDKVMYANAASLAVPAA